MGQQHPPPPARRRCQQEANDIVVVSGPLPVDELNKCLWVSGYVRRMFSRLATCRTASCSSLQSRFCKGGLSPRPSTPFTAGTAQKNHAAPFSMNTTAPVVSRQRRALRPEPGGLQACSRSTPQAQIAAISRQSSPSMSPSMSPSALAHATIVTGTVLARATSCDTEPSSALLSAHGPWRR